MDLNPDEGEKGLRDAIRTHKGKNPNAGIVSKWIKANGISGAVCGSNDSVIERRAKAQFILEKYKLIDCRTMLKASLTIKPTLNSMAEEEKALYKEIFMNDMLESQELSKPLKSIEETNEPECNTNEKLRQSSSEIKCDVNLSKKTSSLDTPNVEENNLAGNFEKRKQLHTCEMVKVERVLFRSPSKETPNSPLSIEDLGSIDENKSSFVINAHEKGERKPHKDEATPVINKDGQQEIFDTLVHLEYLIKNELDICEERTKMSELLDSFKVLLKNYQENSKLELLRSQMKTQEVRRDDCNSCERTLCGLMPELGCDKLVSGIKRLRMETPEHFRASQYEEGPELFRKREPLQHIHSNFSPYYPISYFPQTVHRTIISSQKVRQEMPKSIDISVLKKHNFSVDLISAFH
jgi:hypothetical protein